MSVKISWLWVRWNSGPIFSRWWTKVHQIKLSCSGVIVVCNAVFQLMISCCVPDILAIKSRSCLKSRRNFDVFGPPSFCSPLVALYSAPLEGHPSQTALQTKRPTVCLKLLSTACNTCLTMVHTNALLSVPARFLVSYLTLKISAGIASLHCTRYMILRKVNLGWVETQVLFCPLHCKVHQI